MLGAVSGAGNLAVSETKAVVLWSPHGEVESERRSTSASAVAGAPL